VLFDVYGTLFVSGSGDIDGRTSAVAATQKSGQYQPPLVNALKIAGCHILDAEAANDVGESEYDEVIRSIHSEKRRLGIEHPEVDIIRVWKQVLSELNGSGLMRIPDDSAVPYRVAVAYECLSNPVWPMPDAVEVIDAIASHGIPLGIVSNAQFITPLLFPALLDRTTSELSFDDSLCAYSFQLGEAKPSVRLYESVRETMFRRMAIPPDQVLYVGNDMLNDIWAAAQAGLTTCLFAGDQRSLRLRSENPLCTGTEPDYTVIELRQICDVLGIDSGTL
jgi:putative hydrolase of the HAD superfamily